MQIGCTAQLNDLYFLFLIFHLYIFTIYLHTSEHGSCIIDYYSQLLFLQSFWLGWVVGSWPLFWALFISFILGTAYSINVSCYFNVICYFHAENVDRAWLRACYSSFFFSFFFWFSEHVILKKQNICKLFLLLIFNNYVALPLPKLIGRNVKMKWSFSNLKLL